MGRKTLGAITLIAVFAGTLPAITAGAAGGFGDVGGSVHSADIERLADLGISRGCNPPNNDRFCPDDAVTRAQMATFLVRTFDLAPVGNGTFTDTSDSLHAADIDALAASGITFGCNPPTNDRFCPNGTVTRGQMAAFLARALGLSADTAPGFADTTGRPFEREIGLLAAAGITRGCNPPTNSLYCPDDVVRREQMATFLVRSYDLHHSGPTTPTTSVPGDTSTSTSTSTPGDSSTSTSTSMPEDTTTTTTAPPTTTTTVVPAGAFIESDGAVVMDVESHVTSPGSWNPGTGFGSIGGFFFSDTATGRTQPGFGVLTYPVWISEPGTYVASVRSRRDRTQEEFCNPNDPVNPRNPEELPDAECVDNGERNDIFIRMDYAIWHAKNHKGTTHAAFGSWGWIDKWREDEGAADACPSPGRACEFRAFSWDLDIGLHHLQISERAEQIKIDRIFLYRYDGDVFDLPASRADRPNATVPESDRAG